MNLENIGSPEGVMMLSIAFILDFLGFMLVFFAFAGVDDYGLLDILGTVSIGGWLLIKQFFNSSGTVSAKKKMRGVKFLVSAVTEFCPILGSIMPSWTILVFSELTS